MNEKVPESRRNFLIRCSGILAGLLAPVHIGAANPRLGFQRMLQSIEMEALQSGKPLRIHSENVNCVQAITLNPTAEQIWQACDGRSTASDMARMLCARFAVSYPQAYADTLCFLCELKTRNLIRLQ